MRAIHMLALAMAGLLAMPAASQDGSASSEPETMVGEDGFESPPASIYELSWLVGQWEGEGIGGAPAMESWLPPSGTTMVGTFVQQADEQTIRFTEHMYLMEEAGSLVLRLKHFNPDLTGWEEKDGMLTFRLVALEPCAAFFNALTLRCDGDDGLVAAVRMKSNKPAPQELIFRFTRSQASDSVSYDCDGSTVEMNRCMAEILDRAVERKDRYFAAALERAADRPELVAMMRASEAKFDAYREQECDAVYEDFKEGTIRTMMSITCSLDLVDKRTATIWQNWLSYADSTPADLPKPGPTR